MKSNVAVRLISLGLQHHLVTAVFVILLAAVYTASTQPQTYIEPTDITETGNPSVPFDTNKWSLSLKNKLLPVHRNLTNCLRDKCVALTFDDGPEPVTTPKVLDVLKHQAAPATFFVIGNKIAAHMEIVQRTYLEGHEIGNHSWSHQFFTKLPPEQMQLELDKTNLALQIAGVPPAPFFRPPYGAINRSVTDTVKLPIILWNTDPHDWKAHIEPKQHTAEVLRTIRPGAIVILHDTQKGTAEALPEMIKLLRAEGYKLVTVSQLLELNSSSQGVYYGR